MNTCKTGYRLQAEWYAVSPVFRPSPADIPDNLPRVQESPAAKAALEKYRKHRANCPDCGQEPVLDWVK